MILNQIERIDYLEIIQTPYSKHFCGKHTAMDDNGGSNKVTGIRQIVRLKGILQKWQHVTIGSRANTPSSSSSQSNGGISPAISRRLMGYSVYCDSDIEDGSQSPEPPRDVPKGYLAVYVSSELRRFIIPTCYLSDPLFKVLLEKVEEEFGFDHRGGLTIPCEIETFKYLLKCMENHQKGHADENEGEGGSYFATANTTPTHRAKKGTRNCRCVAALKTTISPASKGDDLATPTGGSTVEINLT